MAEMPTSARKRPRGIYLLPNLFTTAAMFAGFYAIVASIGGRYSEAALAVFIAGILDGLDGRVARLTGTQSDFGVQWGKVGWSAAFIYAACAAMRLARFNTQVGVADKRYFQGLASPAAAGFCMAFVWTIEKFDLSGIDVQFFTPFVAVVAGLLMVSNFRYFSFKSWPSSEQVPFVWIPAALLIIVALVIDPPRVLFAIGVLYLLSGPVMTLWGLRRSREKRALRGNERGEE